MYVQKKAPVDPVTISATMMSRRLLYYYKFHNKDMSHMTCLRPNRRSLVPTGTCAAAVKVMFLSRHCSIDRSESRQRRLESGRLRELLHSQLVRLP